MVFVVSLLLWLLILCAFAGCLRMWNLGLPRGGKGWGIAMAAAVVLGLLFFRPHEEMESGEDPASYLNAAFSFAREGRLTFPDPALSMLEPGERAGFRYGHSAFGFTKDAVLWARSADFNEVGPWFFPATSLLLALPVLLGWGYGAFLVCPLLFLLSAVLVGGLARRWIATPGIGFCAAGLYLLHPVMVWNARAVRAEAPAAFLVLAAVALWMELALGTRKHSFFFGWMAGLCAGGAILFHVTAVFVLLPLVALSFFTSCRQRDWFGWWTGVAVALALFASQTLWLTDPYSLQKRLPLLRWTIPAAVIGGMGLYVLRRFGAKIFTGKTIRVLPPLVFTLTVLVAWFLRDDHGRIPGLPEWTAAYLSLSDFRTVATLMTGLWLLLVLPGLWCLSLRSQALALLAALLVPAAVLMGWMDNTMFETRRMLLALIPLMVFSLCALLRHLPRFGLPLVSLLLIAFTYSGRTRLVKQTDHKGTYTFYKSLAADLQTRADVLVVEYSQVAAPLEALTGLPTFPISPAHRWEHEMKSNEAALLRLVTQQPTQRFALLSAFQTPAIPGLARGALREHSFSTRKLQRARRGIPTGVSRWARTLTEQRLTTAFPVTVSSSVRMFDGSRLGLGGVDAHMGTRPLELQGLRVTTIPQTLAEGSGEWRLLLHAPGADVWDAFVATDEEGRDIEIQAVDLGADFYVMTLQSDKGLVVQAPAGGDMKLVQLFRASEAGLAEVPVPGTPFSVALPSQWLRGDASVALPLGPSGGWMWVLASTGRAEAGDVVSRARVTDETEVSTIHWKSADWSWQPLRIPPNPERPDVDVAVNLKTIPDWNPKLRGYRKDLGLRVAIVAWSADL